MNHTRRWFLGAVFVIALFLSTVHAHAAPPARVVYTATVADTTTKTFRVTARAEGVTDPTVTFSIPAWTPGWYVMTHGYKNISSVSAANDQGKHLTVTHPNDLNWIVTTNGAKNVTITYNLLAKNQDPDALGIKTDSPRSFGFFEPYMDDTNGFLPGPATFMYVANGKTAPCRVTYKVPDDWKVASSNDPVPGVANTFSAPNYDTFADQPADLGNFERVDRTIQGTPVSIVIVGAEENDTKKWVESVFKIADAGIRFWGKAPFPRYIFHFRFPRGGQGGGGLEHLNSTVIALSPSSLRGAGPLDMSLVAHEYFHAWNVKRIRSAALGPFDYTQAVRTKDLWWLEGVTDYYAPRLVVLSTLFNISGPDFWRGYMAYQINDLQGNDARKNVTLETASLKAWEGKSEGFGGLSYYNKGLLVGLLLDVEMRRRTQNKVGLDDLMRELFQEFQTTGKGFPDGEIERIASRLVGADMTPFFDKALRSTEELPFAEILPAAGLIFKDTSAKTPDVGIDFNFQESSENGLKVTRPTPGGGAEKAGILPGDVVVSIDGKTIQELSGSLYEGKKPGDKMTLGILRAGVQKTVVVTVGEKDEHVYTLDKDPAATPQQTAIYDALTSGTIKPAPAP